MLKITHETYIHKSAKINRSYTLSHAFFRKYFMLLSSYALKSNLLGLRFHFYEFVVKAKECGVLEAILVNFKGSQQSYDCPSSP